jgi:hypothetical protein
MLCGHMFNMLRVDGFQYKYNVINNLVTMDNKFQGIFVNNLKLFLLQLCNMITQVTIQLLLMHQGLQNKSKNFLC